MSIDFLWNCHNHCLGALSLAMITPAQCRAARGLLAWSQQDLANEAGVGVVTVHQLEAGTRQPRHATLDVLKRAFEGAGGACTDENGAGHGGRVEMAGRAVRAL